MIHYHVVKEVHYSTIPAILAQVVQSVVQSVVQAVVPPAFVGVPVDLSPTRFGSQTAHHRGDRVIVGSWSLGALLATGVQR